MAYESKNMNYIFNVEYFKNIFDMQNGVEAEIKKRNEAIFKFSFPEKETPLTICEEMEGYRSFSLYTLYPGLLVGTGNPHELAKEGALKCGFTFDYVTGVPYITGSTLKGMLRSYFPGDSKDKEKDTEFTALIKGILGKEELDVSAFKEKVFENNDIFLGAYPVIGRDASLMEMEFITSHKDKFKNPNPVSLIKVKPAVEFTFSFLFSDYIAQDGTVIVSADEKCNLCKELILLMGIGAKTNVGYGRFSEAKPAENILVPRPRESKDANGNERKGNHKNNHNKAKNDNDNNAKIPTCANSYCNKKVTYNKKQEKYNMFCYDCFSKQKENKK